MKKRILSLLLAAMMVVSIFVMPTSVSAADAEPLYSWDGFVEGDIRNHYGEDQVVDLGFDGPIATAPQLDGEIADDEYSIVHRIPFLYNSDTSGRYKPEKTVTDYYVDVNFAVNGDYLYVAFDQTEGPALGDKDPTERIKVQFDLGIAASSSAESAWTRISMSIAADGTVGATTGMFTHEVGGNAYSQSLNGVRAADYLVGQTFDYGTYEVKFDLGQLYRLFANLPGGQDTWDTPCVNFGLWLTTGRTNEEGADHYCYHVSPNFKNVNGRGGNWVPTTVLIPDVTLNALEAKYKGVIAPLGYDYRNAVAGQLVSVEDYATVAPTVDGVVTAEDKYTTTGSWTFDGSLNTLASFNTDCNFSVKDGYLYGAFVADGDLGASTIHLGVFGAVNSTNMKDSRCQTTINAGGAWKKDNGGMWKTANGPTTATKVKGQADNGATGTAVESSNWPNKELNSGASAATAWEKVAYGYNSETNKCTIEFQISIPELLAVLHFEGYNAEEANAAHFMFWPTAVAKAGVTFKISSAIQTQIKQTNGYAYGTSEVTPTVEFPKGCAELYFVEDVDDMGAFGQRIVEAKQSIANVDGTIGAGEYTASIHYNSEDLVNFNTKKALAYDITQTDYYSYDDEYFYYGAKIYDPYYVDGFSQLQLDISVLNKHDPYNVNYTYYTVTSSKVDGVTTYKNAIKTVNTIRENSIDIADVITRASWYVTGNVDGVTIDMNGKPGSVIRSQTLTSGTLAADAQAAFKARANTFGNAGYEFDGSYDAATKTYTYEAKIPLAELKNLFQLDEKFDIDSINFYTLYKFKEPDTGSTNHTQTYQQRTAAYAPAWDALRVLTQATKGSTGTPYNENCIPNVIKFVDQPLTKESASVRISTSNSGLRFKSVYTNDYLAYMAKYAAVKGETMEVGTLIAPNDYVTAAGAFTHAALSAKYGAKGYVEVPAVQATPFQNVNGVTTFAGSLVNIKEANLDRDFAGIGFIKVGNEYFYTDTYAVKNVSDIASAALADTKTAKQAGYKYEVSAGVWSPYSAGQRLVLEDLVA